MAIEIKTPADLERRIEEIVTETAERRHDPTIHCPADFLKLMEESHYPQKHLLDVSYGPEDAQKMDLFYPEEEEGPFPVFIEVHGGGWYFGQKRSIEFEPFLAGIRRGYCVVSLNYTLAPHAHFPQPVEEIKGAIRYLKAHAKELQIDPKRIALWGGSAGAHLAAMAAMSCGTGHFDSPVFGNLEEDSSVAALVLWYGCFDYQSEREQRAILQQNPPGAFSVQNFLGIVNVEKFPSVLESMNPENYVTRFAPPTFFQHGMSDQMVPFLQSVHFYEKIKAVCGADRTRLDLFPGYDHADDLLFAEPNIQKVYDFVDEYLK